MAGDRGRVYGGQSEDERRAERRERLVGAGLTLFGSTGWDGTSIERICSEAGVSTRYFYEEFRGREDLLEAVYAQTADAAVAAVLEAVSRPGEPEQRVALGLRTYLEHVTQDPARVRLLHQDARRIESLAPLSAQLLVTHWTALTAVGTGRALEGAPVPGDASMVRARAVCGAVNEVLAHWFGCGEPRPAAAPMIDRLVRTLAPTVMSACRPA